MLKDHKPSWKAVLILLGVLFAAQFAAAFGLVKYHGEAPHKGAVTKDSFELLVADVTHIRSRVDALYDHLIED